MWFLRDLEPPFTASERSGPLCPHLLLSPSLLSPFLCFPHSDLRVCWPNTTCGNLNTNFHPLPRKVTYLPTAFHKFISKGIFEVQVKGGMTLSGETSYLVASPTPLCFGKLARLWEISAGAYGRQWLAGGSLPPKEKDSR